MDERLIIDGRYVTKAEREREQAADGFSSIDP